MIYIDPNLKVDPESCEVFDPDLHDMEVVALRLIDHSRFEIDIINPKSSDRKVYRFVLERIDHLRVDRFSLLNWVGEIVIMTNERPSPSRAKHAFSEDHFKYLVYNDLLEGVLQRVEDGSLILFEVRPNTGASISVFCGSVKLEIVS